MIVKIIIICRLRKLKLVQIVTNKVHYIPDNNWQSNISKGWKQASYFHRNTADELTLLHNHSWHRIIYPAAKNPLIHPAVL
jgi:hypothetical protein